jgi:GDP/UDP-N,N'-diacetylbacillosamine 2-epimerase (hydrolysing)
VRRIAVVTVARSDYGIYKSILNAIRTDKELELSLLVGGMHLSPEFGNTVTDIESDGFEIAAKIEMLLSSDSAEGVAKSIGIGVLGFAQAYADVRPDLLLLLGDRFEMLSAAVAALPFGMPIAHIHGGESTEGAMDEAIRHSITKMSHLHFASTEAYAKRIIQMGEEPWRVTVSGAPALDNLARMPLLKKEALEQRFGFSLKEPTLLVTYHPVTSETEDTSRHVEELLAALTESGFALIFTSPNADHQGRAILQKIQDFVLHHPRAWFVANVGQEGYFSLMAQAAAMVGNSSSGMIEAASFGLPVVNIGSRQRGRVHGQNVLNVGYAREKILEGVRRATQPPFKLGLATMKNPYGDGQAAEKIVNKLKNVPLNRELLVKHFHVI